MSFQRTLALALALCGLTAVSAAAPQDPVDDHAGHNHAPGEHPTHDHDGARPSPRSAPWPSSILELAESLPVQDGGRVKPFHTYAAFTMLRIHGKRSMKIDDETKLTPVEWLLDTLYFPDMASDYELFLVQNDEVISALNLSIAGKKKRDRYSYNELRPGIPTLFKLADEYRPIPEQSRSLVQQQVFLLAGNVNSYLQLARHMDFARARIPIGSSESLSKIFDGAEEIAFHDILANIGEIARLYQGLNQLQPTPELEAISGLIEAGDLLSRGTYTLAMLPPSTEQGDAEAWETPTDLFARSVQGERTSQEHLDMLASLSRIAAERDDFAAFETELRDFHGQVVGRTKARGEYGKIGMEVSYYKSKILSRSLYLFILAFLSMAFMWLRPHSKLLHRSTSILVLLATIGLVGTITWRCIIRGRPPVSTLYETVLFVTAVGAIIALGVEAIGRRRIAISAAATLGVVGLFIANGYEMLDKQDTMPSLVAVLDTNFWLATHVTSITIGYSAGMLAALLGSFYLIAKAFRIKADDRAFYKSMARMTYGVVAFGLIFAVVGTILGGIWANDSWGRFWGWDPKENGALLICLSQIAILHGRMGGYLRDHGVCMAAAFSGTIVAFSWWGVNLLGVGLHSYGFTSGISKALWIYYGIQWSVVGLGAITWWFERHPVAVAAPASPASSQGKAGTAETA